ncbi:MAG: nuclear transport factor 2 family protein [Rhodobacter sp.]|nr:nuclear transport factor 2 family protein [Rhodobacter sp.]MCY4167929.1 nuclear transport factor 2 family protein [Rhodobacter sp.]MCY4243170.1 nuclear transport factor 2 family protein [Rhodobacter sp.]
MTPEETIRAFLAALEVHDLEAAKTLLHPEFEMVFPGGAAFKRLEHLIDWTRPRYRNVVKRIERIDVANGAAFAQGTLHGQWPDGAAFDGIRFADWFEFKGGLIRRQRVWNDLAEVRLRVDASAKPP